MNKMSSKEENENIGKILKDKLLGSGADEKYVNYFIDSIVNQR